ncbi:MAG: hypothetical protein IPL84_04050 [Chitinophagaceae bacterium]|nr:hypothetical protein [Chitinophagaceae bacterium]
MKEIRFKIKRLREMPQTIKPLCICFWCGAIYSKLSHLEEHQKYHCSPKNMEAGSKRFEHLFSLVESQKHL